MDFAACISGREILNHEVFECIEVSKESPRSSDFSPQLRANRCHSAEANRQSQRRIPVGLEAQRGHRVIICRVARALREEERKASICSLRFSPNAVTSDKEPVSIIIPMIALDPSLTLYIEVESQATNLPSLYRSRIRVP